jgi:DNA replication and repair protein RecF
LNRRGVQLLSLVLSDFRNLAQVQLRPSAHTTVAFGHNGQGKTNLLEAVYFLATLKPLRSSKLVELIRFGVEQAQVLGRFAIEGTSREISVRLQPGLRQAFVDGKRTQNLDEYFGSVSVVSFTPDDLAVVKGGPDQRRRFLDRAVFNRYPVFLKETRNYTIALKSRNRLLKEGADLSYLDVYDEALATTGARIWCRREKLLQEMAPRTEQAFGAIARINSALGCGYVRTGLSRDQGSTEAELAVALKQGLRIRLPKDAERGFTSIGPHTDDLEFSFGEHPARSFGSQGQQRALVLAWKIAEIENLRDANGLLPLLLLDDVSSELDRARNDYLMNYLAGTGAQVFLTTTDPALVVRATGPDTVWYEVEGGSVNLAPAPAEALSSPAAQ